MQKLRKLFPLAGALLALAFVSCGSDSDSDSKTAGSISYATTSVSKTTADEAFTNTLTKTGDGTVSYASSKTDVAEVNTQNGLVTIKGAGETTITATVADSENYTYATKTASYTLTVTQASPLNLNLKTGSDINSILLSLCKDEYGYPACTKFARSETNNDEATLYLDTEGKYIPVWSVDTEVYYYVPDGCTPVMNEDSSEMFKECAELTELDVSKFDTSKVENMSGMFNYCYALTSLDVTGFDTSNVTNMSEMFYYCSKLTELDVSKFDTSKVTDMSCMFTGCYDLSSLDVTGFDTSNVTNMNHMFGGCKLTELDVTGFDTSNVTNMEGMFASCSKLTGLDVSKFVTSKVTNMQAMFNYCSGLKSLDVTGFDTSNVTDMSSMFTGCSGLKSLDVTGFDTSNVTSMSGMFHNCSGLTILDLSNFDTSKVSNMWGMFSYCEGLTKIYASDKFVTTSIPDDDINTKYMCFFFCKKLVGGAGTTFDASNNDQALAVPYARIDGGTDVPGYFTLKLIGNKSKPDAVGDIVFNDGSATPYTADLTLTEEQKAAAIALIFYKGTGLNSGDDTTTSRTLGVGLKHTGLAWCQDSAAAYSKNITTIQCPPSGDDGALTFTGDRDGSDNLEQIEAFDGVDDTATEANYYPAFYFAKNYGTTAANLGDSYKDGWYFPSIAELFQIYACRADTENGFDIDAASSLCGGDQFDTGFYWSSSQFKHSPNGAYTFTFSNGGWNAADKKYDHYYVCAVRAFN